MTIYVEEEVKVTLDFDYEALAREVITFAIDYMEFPYEAEVNLLLVDNDAIQSINKEQRDIDAPTDVLSFPMLEYPTPGDFDAIDEQLDDCVNPDSEEVVLGDIVISVDKVIEQATNYGHSTKREFAFLIIHSMLHLFGYDHMTPEEEAEMFAKQEEILEQLGILR